MASKDQQLTKGYVRGWAKYYKGICGKEILR